MKKVLIVEDDEDTLDMLGMFASHFNYEVILKPQITSIEELQEINPDLILLDHWVGQRLGSKFCAQLKSNPLTNHIPIVLMSAISDIGHIAREACADGALIKPFDLDQVEAIFDAYLGE